LLNNLTAINEYNANQL